MGSCRARCCALGDPREVEFHTCSTPSQVALVARESTPHRAQPCITCPPRKGALFGSSVECCGVTRRARHCRENALLPHPPGTAHQQSISSASSSEISSSGMFPRTSSLPTPLTPAWPVTWDLLPADVWLPLCNEDKPGLAGLHMWEVSFAVSDQYIAA